MSWESTGLLVLWLVVLGGFWGSIWLFLANFTLEGSRREGNRTLRVVRAILAPLPLLWLLTFGVLLLRACLEAGEWPVLHPFDFARGWSSNIPASTFALHLKVHDVLTYALVFAVLAFPPIHAILRATSAHRSRGWAALFVLPLLLVACLAVTEGPANAQNWLATTR